MNGHVYVTNFAQGLGNRLYKYVYARLLSEKLDIPFYHDNLLEFNLKSNYSEKEENGLRTIQVMNFKQTLESPQRNVNYEINGAGCGRAENYLIYKPYLEKIRTFFPKVEKTNHKDLCIHLRGGNVWVNNIIHDLPKAESWKRLIESVNYEKVYIVTNVKITRQWTLQDIHDLKDKLRKEGGDGDKAGDYNKNYGWGDEDFCLNRINEVLEYLNTLNPIWVNNENLMDDFEFIRTFDKIAICASTFAWWASVLSDASEVHVYKPWKSIKGPKNKNLGLTDYPNWRQWE